MPELRSKYKILKEHNLFIVVHNGTLNLNSMMDFIQTINSDPEFTPKLNHIVDLNNVQFELTQEDMNNYVNHLESNSKTQGDKRIAVITSTPNQVTYSTLYKLAKKELQPLQSIQIFSTTQKAFDFIGLKNISFEEVSQTLKMLNK